MRRTRRRLRLGLISDTHGLLRPEAVAFLRGSDHIVHAGDIGKPGILDALAALAPLTAVRGNNDTQDWARHLPGSADLTFGALRVHVVHDIADLGVATRDACDVIVCGHSHQPRITTESGVLLVNPGSAGPRRFRLPVTAAELMIEGRNMRARIAELLESAA